MAQEKRMKTICSESDEKADAARVEALKLSEELVEAKRFASEQLRIAEAAAEAAAAATVEADANHLSTSSKSRQNYHTSPIPTYLIHIASNLNTTIKPSTAFAPPIPLAVCRPPPFLSGWVCGVSMDTAEFKNRMPSSTSQFKLRIIPGWLAKPLGALFFLFRSQASSP